MIPEYCNEEISCNGFLGICAAGGSSKETFRTISFEKMSPFLQFFSMRKIGFLDLSIT